jgi:hypothetical protein
VAVARDVLDVHVILVSPEEVCPVVHGVVAHPAVTEDAPQPEPVITILDQLLSVSL